MDKNAEPSNRVMALWASFFDLYMSKQGKPLAFSLYADSSNEHEVRIAALQMIFHSKPSSTELAQVVAVLRNEKCPEVINFAFTWGWSDGLTILSLAAKRPLNSHPIS